MPDPQTMPPPVSDALTEGIRVEVLARYSPENSGKVDAAWVFEYTVRISNLRSDSVQLLNRHWYITDAYDAVREVQGAGVVGRQPVLGPGEAFQYSSWCPLSTPTGMMRGTYEFGQTDGIRFTVDIAPFGLRAKYTIQ